MAYVIVTGTGMHRAPRWSRDVIRRMRGKAGSRGALRVSYLPSDNGVTK